MNSRYQIGRMDFGSQNQNFPMYCFSQASEGVNERKDSSAAIYKTKRRSLSETHHLRRNLDKQWGWQYRQKELKKQYYSIRDG